MQDSMHDPSVDVNESGPVSNDMAHRERLYREAMNATERGWAVTPVHGVQDGSHCTCGRRPCETDNRNAGKHPVWKQWQKGEVLSRPDVFSLWGEDVGDGCTYNVGILTGVASGIWVLDIDPKNGGDDCLSELLAKHGSLPPTYQVRTGSGGWHFYFTMPDFPLGNVRVPEFAGRGIDVRGTGGQVVGAGSVSGVGPYEAMGGAEVLPAPSWLLEMVRAPIVTGKVVEPCMIEDLPRWEDLTPGDRRRVEAYARAAIASEVRSYQNEPIGYGSLKLFSVCCSVIEFVQAPWNPVTGGEAYDLLERARAARSASHPSIGGGQTAAELERTWSSARSRVVGQARPYPEGGIAALDVEPIQLGGVGAGDDPAYNSATSGATDLRERSEIDGADIFGDVGSRLGVAASSAVSVGLGEPIMTRGQKILSEMLSADDLESMPNPEPLVADLLDMDSESWIIAEPGGFKSVVALDLAGHVSRGLDWRGKKVKQGNVIYVVAEGSKGIKLRAQAWKRNYGAFGPVSFLPRPVQVSDIEDWAGLIEAAQEIKPVLIILDTQARITVGLDENQARDMGVLIEAVRKLRVATGACVLVVHHVGRNGGDARGSSALDGAQDTEIRVTRPGGGKRKMLTATIGLDKQKDGDESTIFKIQLKVHQLGTDPVTGRKLTGIAIEPMDPDEVEKVVRPEWLENITENQRWVMEIMRDHSDEMGATRAVIRRWLKERGHDINDSSSNSAIRDLKVKGLLVSVGEKLALAEFLE